MAWDSVPWFVGGGAQHSPEVARVLAYAAFGSGEGIVGSKDLRVKAQSVPDGTVRVLPGAASILNRATAQAYQAYVARLTGAESVAVAATDSSGPRSDLIVARIEDPFLSGEPWQEPDDPTRGPYVFTRVIPDVDPSTTSLQEVEPGQSGITLARVDIPASTGAITQAMLTDLRVMPRPRQEPVVRVHNQTTTANNRLTNSSFVKWPTQPNLSVRVPEWATRAQIVLNIGGFEIVEGGSSGGNVWGDFRARMGSEVTQSTVYNYSSAAGLGKTDASSSVVADEIEIPEALRGTTADLAFEAKRDGGSTDCVLQTNEGMTQAWQIVFYEAPDNA